MHKIHISFDTKVWKKNYNNIEKIIRNILKKSIMSEKKFLSKNVEISVLLTSSKKMIILNHKFRKKKKILIFFLSQMRSPIFIEKN